MEQEIIDFLTEKGILMGGKTKFEITFSDGRVVSVNDLIEEFAEINSHPANLKNL